MVHADRALALSSGSLHALTSNERGKWQQEKDGYVKEGEWGKGWDE